MLKKTEENGYLYKLCNFYFVTLFLNMIFDKSKHAVKIKNIVVFIKID